MDMLGKKYIKVTAEQILLGKSTYKRDSSKGKKYENWFFGSMEGFHRYFMNNYT